MKVRGVMIKGEEEAMLVAERILENAMSDPRIREVVEQMFADPNVTKDQLFCTAFAQGVISTLAALREGRLVPITGSRN